MRQVLIGIIVFWCVCVIFASAIIQKRYEEHKKEKYLKICQKLNIISLIGIAVVLMSSLMLFTGSPTPIELDVTIVAGLFAMGSFALSIEIRRLLKSGMPVEA